LALAWTKVAGLEGLRACAGEEADRALIDRYRGEAGDAESQRAMIPVPEQSGIPALPPPERTRAARQSRRPR
jgi:hypothetical protein